MEADRFDARIQASRLKASALRIAAALEDLNTATLIATKGMTALADALWPLEEWPDVVLEDVLDAEEIG